MVTISPPAATPQLVSPSSFQAAYPDCDLTELRALRASEYSRLDAQGHAYLDYTGGGLYAASQLRAHQALLAEGVFGNPHSTNPTSLAATELAERARSAVLAFFNADPAEYTVIFTPNASGALKLVGEAFPFAPGGQFLLTADNHNSVNGIREFARARGAAVTYLPLASSELRVERATLVTALRTPATGHGRLERLWTALAPRPLDRPRLFAYPAQSNFSGVQHPLEWIELAQAHGWSVLLDAASFAPTNRLDLARWRPDFVPLSFYKLFGYPTGIGALVVRRTALAQLRRPWFAGGTITIASVRGDGHYLAGDEVGFEDGTINYLGLPAIEIGLGHLAAVGPATIHHRVQCLTGWLLEQLTALRHANGAPLIQIYGPTTTAGRGGTVTFNVLTATGQAVDFRRVEAAANAQHISLRTGCFCNPGAREAALGWSAAELRPLFQRAQPISPDDLHKMWPARAIGAVRVSTGIATTPEDIARCVELLQTFAE